MKRTEKEAQVQMIKEKLSEAQAVILADYRGLTVEEMTELRKKLREAGVELRVVKNTLARLAAKEAKIDDLDSHLNGPIAMAFGIGDPVAPAKILHTFARTHKNLELKAGLLEKKILDRKGIEALAALPTREVLLAQLAAAMVGPLRNLGFVLSAPIRDLVYVLEAVRKKQHAQEA
ncbi:MAG TPA: 50S ribosomal protein L10 [Firmicutes bacterium]|jgi:large subunit ribosomal protein L10|nr:50S ribosomal protein L10 [Bacillota bacterium]